MSAAFPRSIAHRTSGIARCTVGVLTASVLACACEPSYAIGAGSRDTLPDGTILVRHGALASSGVPVVEADLVLGTIDGDPNLVFLGWARSISPFLRPA